MEELQQRHSVLVVSQPEGGVVGSLYASLKILFTSPCIKTNLASLCVVFASAAVFTHFWTASVRTGAGVDTVGVAFDVLLPVELVRLMLDCCDAII